MSLPNEPTERVSDVVGRPAVSTVIGRAVVKLHFACKGCDCQHGRIFDSATPGRSR